MRSRYVKLLLILAILVSVGLACSFTGGSEEGPTQAPQMEQRLIVEEAPPVPPAETLPFVGTWVSEDRKELYQITSDSVYNCVLKGGDILWEELFEIIEYDIDSGHIKVRKISILSNGNPMGFDYPEWHYAYRIQGDALQISIESMDYPEVAESQSFYYDEHLSP